MPDYNPSPLTVGTLNVGRMLQPRTRTYLDGFTARKWPLPDVFCFQDLPLRDYKKYREEWEMDGVFAAMTNHLINGERAVVGIAMFSRYPLHDVRFRTTWGDGTLKDLQGVDDKNQRYLGVESDKLVEATEDRVAICATVRKDGRKYNIATTHGMWVRGGVTNDQQRESARRLRAFLQSEGEGRDGLLLVGDLNFGRGGEIYKMFVGNLCGSFSDCMPPEIDNTLDPDHPFVKKNGKVVTDWFFQLNRHDRTYCVDNVRLVSGVSDHCALFGTVSIDYGL